FTKAPEFGDTVLDFNLYFLGYRPPHMRDATGALMDTVTKRASVFAFPNAVASAQELLKGGDYLKLFAYDQSLDTGPRKTPKPVDGHPEYSEDQLREYYFDRGAVLLDRAISLAGQGMPANQKDYCETLVNKDNFFTELIDAGVPENLDYHLGFREQSV